jgi:hypothetical protein
MLVLVLVLVVLDIFVLHLVPSLEGLNFDHLTPTSLPPSAHLQVCLIITPIKMKYNIPTLMALYQDTEVTCNWTGHVKDCPYLLPIIELAIFCKPGHRQPLHNV